MANDTALRLAPHALLAFDDFSLAGRHTLAHFDVDAHQQTPLALLPEELKDLVMVTQYTANSTRDAAPTFSVVRVATASLEGDALWRLADALVQFLSDAQIQTLSVVASLHLPQAKPHTDLLANVYHGVLQSSPADSASKSDASLPFESLDASWEIKDAFLSRLLHFARVEQAFATHLLVMKGYKPGRDGAGAREAVQTLAKALPLYVAGGSVDVQKAVDSAYKALGAAPSESPLNLLYQ